LRLVPSGPRPPGPRWSRVEVAARPRVAPAPAQWPRRPWRSDARLAGRRSPAPRSRRVRPMQRFDGMRPFLVVHATRSGHTRRIAERIVDRIRSLAHEAQLQDVRTEALPPLTRYSAVILAAGVH